MSAAQRTRGRPNMQPPGLNIYTPQSSTENARSCRDSGAMDWWAELSAEPPPSWCRWVLGVMCGEQPLRGADPPGLGHQLGQLVKADLSEPDEDRRVAVVMGVMKNSPVPL